LGQILLRKFGHTASHGRGQCQGDNKSVCNVFMHSDSGEKKVQKTL